MIVGKRLKELREKHHMTQTELGEYLGVQKSAISLYEHEKRNISVLNLKELSDVFGILPNYILGCDVITEVEDEDPPYRVLTKEEMLFIESLRRNQYLYEILLSDHKRGIELIKLTLG